jgi:tetratricopeptide (TPR) repeat protein
MRLSKLWIFPLTLALAWASAASADDKPKKKGDDSAAKKDGAKDKKDEAPGLKGISPYTEKLIKGHKLVAARDFAGAVDAYRSAIADDDKNAQGHYYLGAAQLLKGDLNEAEASWQNALRIAPKDTLMQSKVRFGLADLRERQRKLEDSKTAWQEYGKFVADNPKVPGYPNTPGERQKAVDRWTDLEKKYGEVKARIAAREKEQKEKMDKEAEKSAAEENKKGKKLPQTAANGRGSPLPGPSTAQALPREVLVKAKGEAPKLRYAASQRPPLSMVSRSAGSKSAGSQAPRWISSSS